MSLGIAAMFSVCADCADARRVPKPPAATPAAAERARNARRDETGIRPPLGMASAKFGKVVLLPARNVGDLLKLLAEWPSRVDSERRARARFERHRVVDRWIERSGGEIVEEDDVPPRLHAKGHRPLDFGRALDVDVR